MPTPDSTPSPSPAPAPAKARSHFKNWISLVGTIIAAGSFFAFVFLFAIQEFTHDRNQYLGILTFVVAPIFLITGLLFIFAGWIIQRRAMAKLAPGSSPAVLAIDLSRPQDRRRFGLFMGGAFVFLLLTAFGSYETFHYTESVEFCGTLCHGVMGPEFTAYQRGEHARVACVQCHVGGGADHYLKSKINGAHQLLALVRDNYARPIPTPVRNLRPAQDTCEQCHWPERFTGGLERRFDHVMSDKANTPFTVRLLLKVGGGADAKGPVNGIHWHMSKANKVEYYATDDKRQDIVWVRTTLADGRVRVYRKGEFKDEPPAAKLRTMDCVDCHTRPAHNYRAPNDEVEAALHRDLISVQLPEIKRTVVGALSAEYASTTEALGKIDAAIRGKYGARTEVDAAVKQAQEIYRLNFFPDMKVSWKAYTNNIGHKNSAGCFRCHNDALLAGGKTPLITQNDCNSCHTILAQGKGAELHQLAPEGLEFKHPEGDTAGLLCSDCHNGGNQ